MIHPPRFIIAALLVVAAPGVSAQERYPTRPVTIILPLAAGSASDIAVRVISERLAESLQQGFPVENVPGATGIIGTERWLRAKPDGYTLAALNNSITTILPNINPDKTRFDAARDFVPISGLANIPTLLGVGKDVPIANVRELVAFAKANPGKLSGYGARSTRFWRGWNCASALLNRDSNSGIARPSNSPKRSATTSRVGVRS